MPSIPENSLTELEKFIPFLYNIHYVQSIQEQWVYYFQNRTLFDVVRMICEDDTQIDQCISILSDLSVFLQSEIKTTSDKFSSTGLPKDQFEEYRQKLSFLFELHKSVTENEKLSMEKSILEPIEDIKIDVRIAYNKSHKVASYLWRKLDENVYSFFIGVPIVAEPFARDDGIITSSGFEKARKSLKDAKPKFINALTSLLESDSSKIDTELLNNIATETFEFELTPMESENLLKSYFNRWKDMMDHNDKKSKCSFLNIFKQIYFRTGVEKRHSIATDFYGYFYKVSNSLPHLEYAVEDYDKCLTQALNNLPTDHQLLNTDPEKCIKAMDEVVWFLLITPWVTLDRLFKIACSSKNMVPLICRICRDVPSLFQLEVVDNDGINNETPEPIIITTLRRMFRIGAVRWTTVDEWNSIGFLALSLAKKKKNRLNESSASLDLYNLTKLTIDELLFFNQSQNEVATEMFAKLLARIIMNNENTKERVNYTWTNSLSGKNEKNVLNGPELVILLNNLILQRSDENNNITDYSIDILKSVCISLSESNIVFESKTADFMLHQFNKGPWFLKYAVCSWLSNTLCNQKRQVPLGIYEALPEPKKDSFEKIVWPTQSSVAECYLKSFFELGLFDVDLATELLEFGLIAPFSDEESINKVALAMVDCYSHQQVCRKKGDKNIPRLLRSLLEFLDPARSYQKLKFWADCMFKGLKSIDHFLLLARAVKIAFEIKNKTPINENRNLRIHNEEIATKLLDIYCEASKKMIDEEMAKVKSFRDKTRKVIFESLDEKNEGWKLMTSLENDEKILMFHLTLLFQESIIFTRQFKQVPIKLKLLLSTIVEMEQEVHVASSNHVLDDMITEKSKQNVAYAFTNYLSNVTGSTNDQTQDTAEENLEDLTVGDNNISNEKKNNKQINNDHIPDFPNNGFQSTNFERNNLMPFYAYGRNKYYNRNISPNSNNNSNNNSKTTWNSKKNNDQRDFSNTRKFNTDNFHRGTNNDNGNYGNEESTRTCTGSQRMSQRKGYRGRGRAH